jgi:hypothetical protein
VLSVGLFIGGVIFALVCCIVSCILRVFQILWYGCIGWMYELVVMACRIGTYCQTHQLETGLLHASMSF